MVFDLTLNSNNLSESIAKLLEKLILTKMSGKEEQKANYYPDLIKLISFGLYPTLCTMVAKQHVSAECMVEQAY